MRKNTALKILNPILAILIVTQVLSGVLGFRLSFEVFNVVHKGGGAVLSAAIVLHVVLNWSWVRTNLLSGRRG